MNDTTKLGLLLPAALNPATAALVGITAIAVGLYRMLPDDDEEGTVEDAPSDGPKLVLPVAKQPLPTVKMNEVQRVDVSSIEPLQTPPGAPEEAEQSEMIRRAMSELGKRSAAARAKKKAEQGQMP